MFIDDMKKGNSVRGQARGVKAGLHRGEPVPRPAKTEIGFATRVHKTSVVISLVLVLSVWTASGRGEMPQSPNAPQQPPAILLDEVAQLTSSLRQ